MYGKIMSIPDHLLMHYFELLTRVPEEELEQMRQQLAERSVNPMELKMRLAREIVGILHSAEAAQAAEAEFARVFRQREIPEEAIAVIISFQEVARRITAVPEKWIRLSRREAALLTTPPESEPLSLPPDHHKATWGKLSRVGIVRSRTENTESPLYLQEESKIPIPAVTEITHHRQAITSGVGIVLSIADLIECALNLSRTEARRLMRQGALELDDRKLDKEFVFVRHGSIIRVGKHRFLRIVDADKQDGDDS
jgi:tyrosyl-tRNA synthetase